MAVVESDGEVCTSLKALQITEVCAAGVLIGYRNWAENTRRLIVSPVHLKCACQHGVKVRNCRSAAEGRSNQASHASTSAACPSARASSPRADCATQSSHPATGRILHYAEGHAENRTSAICAKDFCVSDIQVVARDRNVQVVLEGQSHCIVHREINLSVTHELVNAR